MRRLAPLVLLGAFAFIPTSAHAQNRVVTSCGSTSPFASPNAGSQSPIYMDTNGNLCTNASGGSGGGTSSSFNATFPATGTAAGAEYLSSPPTYTSGQMVPLQTDASGNLLVNIKAGAGSGGTAITDNTAFTQSTTSETPTGCLFITSYTAATSGRSTIPQCDSTGHLLIVPTQGGAVLSATNGGYTNLLQGNAVISATNGEYANLLQGNAVISAANPLFTNLSQGSAALTNANPIFSGLSIAGAAVSATNGEYANLLQGNAVISATNGLYANALQGNAVVSVTNPTFTEVTDGTHAAAATKAASTAAVATDPALVVAISPNNTPNLPNGAATSANQLTEINDLATIATNTGASVPAGSNLIGQIDILGNAGAIMDFVNNATSGTTSPPNSLQVAGQYLSSAVALTTGKSAPLQMDSSGNLLVNIKAGAGSGGTAIVDNHAFTQSTTNETPMGCLAITTYTAATSGNSTIPQCSTVGHLQVDVFGSGGNSTTAAPGFAAPPAAFQIGFTDGVDLQTPNTRNLSSGVLSATVASGTGAAAAFTVTNTFVAGEAVTIGGTTAPGGFIKGNSYYVAASPAPTGSVVYLSATYGGTAIAYSTAGSAVTLQAVIYYTGVDLSSENGVAITNTPTSVGTEGTGTTATWNVHITGCNSGGAPCNVNGSATSANSSPVVIASDQVAVAVKAASGAFASGALASGSIASGALAAGSIASGAAVSGAFATGAIVDLANAQGATTSGIKGPLVFGSATTNAPSDTTADSWPLSLTVLGGLRTDMSSIGNFSFGNNTNPPAVAVSSAPTTAGNQALVVDLRPDSPGIITLGPASAANSIPHVFSSQYPVNNNTTTPTAETISATGTTAAFTATLAAGTGSQVTYLCGFEIDAAATAGTAVTSTVTGTVTGTLNFIEFVGALVTPANGKNLTTFNPCIPGSAAATAIVIHAGAAGSGGVSSISAWGYLL